MKIKNLKIGTQLKLGIAAMLLLVAVLGVVSYQQSEEISMQTETLYNHPLKVRLALGELKSDILTIQRNMKDLFLKNSKEHSLHNTSQNEILKQDVFEQIGILYDQYLGPQYDIDSVKQAFVTWNSMRDETMRLIYKDEIEEALQRSSYAGVVAQQVEVLLTHLGKLDRFAKNKSNELYTKSKELSSSLNYKLLMLVIAILILSFLINYVLLTNIRKPLKELTRAAQLFETGDMNARSTYSSKNEFGILSDSFNSMVQDIQVNADLDARIASLAALMLSEYDAKKFFHATLTALAENTSSQMAAIYLLSDDKTTYQHFESLGTDENARQSFSANNFDGVFGTAVATKKVQHIASIPENTRFVFNTVTGKFIPNEIICLPILADNEVIAIISLASISKYTKQSIQLINNILVTLCARVEGIMAYHKMKEFSEKLTYQNSELEAQKTELSSQSSELTEQNMELEFQKKQLDEASRLKTNFLSNMSHELRTPLNSVIALSGVLNRRLTKTIPAQEASYLEVIERNGKHLLELINDILDISRIEAGREEIEISEFNVNNLVAEVVSMIKPQADEKNIKLLHIDSDISLPITNDSGKCLHILQNLIGNAVKFTEKGKVEVAVHKSDSHINVIISDSGIGVSEKHLPHIFNEFRQADGSTSRKYGGTGLGLSIAKKYANLLGGNITVKSELNKGSEFTLSLPLLFLDENKNIERHSADALELSELLLTRKKHADSTVKTILLVEDSEPAIIQITDFLEENGYKMLIARNGGEALEIIDHTIPDALILDLMMPDIDGFEVLKTLRNAEPTAHIPVLILTAKHITKEELKFLKRNNVHQLIQKGDVNRIDLQKAVASMVSDVVDEIQIPNENIIREIIGKPLILVVEDNPDNMITVKALLSDNFKVIEAVNGIESIEMAMLHKPNLIFMDIALPIMDGITAFLKIRKDVSLQHIPIIALTASAMTTDRETILAYGFDAYLAKPIDEKLFFKTINEILYGK